MSREQRFLDYFKAWRDEQETISEEAIFKTALLIEDFVSQNHPNIMMDSLDNDPALFDSLTQYNTHSLNPLNQVRHRRSYGTLLFGILSIEDYSTTVIDADGDEADYLREMSTALKHLYIEARVNPSEKLQQLIHAAHHWITLENHQPREAAIQLKRALYATVAIFHKSLSLIEYQPRVIQGLIAIRVDVNQLKSQLKSLLEVARNTIITETAAAQDTITQAEEDEDDFEECNPPPPILSMDAFYERASHEILEQPDVSVLHKIEQIKNLLTTASSSVLELIHLKHQKMVLESEVASIQRTLLEQKKQQQSSQQAAEKNSTTLGWVGSALITTVPTFHHLWGQLALGRGFEGLSSISSQSVVHGAMSQDSLSPDELRLRQLRGDVDEQGHLKTPGIIYELDREISRAIDPLIGSSHSIKTLFAQASISELDELLTKHEKSSVLMSSMTDLMKAVQDSQKICGQAKNLDTRLDAFILKYESFLVKLSLFLAKYIHAIFKSDTAHKIEESRTIKNQLSTITKIHQDDITAGKTTINGHINIPEPIKTAILTELDAEPPIEESPINAPDFISQFTLVKTMFTSIKSQHEQVTPTLQTVLNTLNDLNIYP